jgi:RNA methyltransferase, TrmH family
MEITSPANSQLKWARRIRDSREPGLIFVEGVRLANECLKSSLKLHSAFYLAKKKSQLVEVLRELERRKCPLIETALSAFKAISDTVTSQGLIVIAHEPQRRLDDVFTVTDGMQPLIIALDQIQDPGNVGVIIRSAEASGASGAVVLTGTSSPFSPKALRSSMGSAFRFPLAEAIDVGTAIEAALSRQLTLVAADARATRAYTDYDWSEPTLIFFGNEGKGVSPEILDACAITVRIPILPSVESLNVSTAAAVMLFEAARQRNLNHKY